MTVGDLVRTLQQVYKLPIVVSAKREQIVRGKWSSSREFVRNVSLELGLNVRVVEGVWLLTDVDEDFEYVRWASGRETSDAEKILAGLQLSERAVVDSSGVAFIAASRSKAEGIRKVLSGIDSGHDWLVQVTIVDASITNSLDASAAPELDAYSGGWFVGGSEAVDTFLFTMQSSSPQRQSFGSRVPFRTSRVTEQGVFIDGTVEYQDIESVIECEIAESVSGPKVKLTVESKRPGVEREGLFEILSEEIDTEFFVRSEPVRVGSLKRWNAKTQSDASWPLLNLVKSFGSRRYDVWLHAVRLQAPAKDLENPQVDIESLPKKKL